MGEGKGEAQEWGLGCITEGRCRNLGSQACFRCPYWAWTEFQQQLPVCIPTWDIVGKMRQAILKRGRQCLYRPGASHHRYRPGRRPGTSHHRYRPG
eukprot:1146449-Pelagomonas_calceolata.AAC.9